ncbi:hypothetical protein [Streptomyces sp. NPDC001404]|uniref:hypothetical protein n=1 Tax=Streptomyces sp. NPDC001404 TaxID=3364571 RepID=UPI0036B26E0F
MTGIPLTRRLIMSASALALAATGTLAAAPTAPAAAAPAKACAMPDLWKPYPRKIGRDWYVEAGGRLHNCGLTYLDLELQKNGRTVAKKSVTRQGDINPRYKCHNFKPSKWRIIGTWWKPRPQYPGFTVINKWASHEVRLNCS